MSISAEVEPGPLGKENRLDGPPMADSTMVQTS